VVLVGGRRWGARVEFGEGDCLAREERACEYNLCNFPSANLLFCRKMFACLGFLGRGEAALWDIVFQSPALEFFGVDSSRQPKPLPHTYRKPSLFVAKSVDCLAWVVMRFLYFRGDFSKTWNNADHKDISPLLPKAATRKKHALLQYRTVRYISSSNAESSEQERHLFFSFKPRTTTLGRNRADHPRVRPVPRAPQSGLLCCVL